MEGRRFIRTLRLQNFLSYGPGGTEVELEPLNVLIGANGSGKSNLIEAVNVLRSAPGDLAAVFRKGGGVGEWLWKGDSAAPLATLDATFEYPKGATALRHRLRFGEVGQRFRLEEEVIEDERSGDPGDQTPDFYYMLKEGKPVLNVRWLSGAKAEPGERFRHELKIEEAVTDRSILCQRRDPDLYPELAYLADMLAKVRLYGEANCGRGSAPRLPQTTDLPDDFLLEDASNLALILNELDHGAETHDTLRTRLAEFCQDFERVSTLVRGGTIQTYVSERSGASIPATRLSDGTLRYLCLLAVLCHPKPPPLICLEEPELGLHPDALPLVARLLLDASKRTQLIVSTHSDDLVSALTETPEAVIVCDPVIAAASTETVSVPPVFAVSVRSPVPAAIETPSSAASAVVTSRAPVAVVASRSPTRPVTV